MTRQFCFSCSVFGGYTTTIHVDSSKDSLDTLTQKAVNALKLFLKQNNLWALQDQLSVLEKRYHIHSHTLENILDLQSSETVYVCPCNQQTR